MSRCVVVLGVLSATLVACGQPSGAEPDQPILAQYTLERDCAQGVVFQRGVSTSRSVIASWSVRLTHVDENVTVQLQGVGEEGSIQFSEKDSAARDGEYALIRQDTGYSVNVVGDVHCPTTGDQPSFVGTLTFYEPERT